MLFWARQNRAFLKRDYYNSTSFPRFQGLFTLCRICPPPPAGRGALWDVFTKVRCLLPPSCYNIARENRRAKFRARRRVRRERPMDPLAFVPACNASLTGGMGGSASFSAAWSGFVSFFPAYFMRIGCGPGSAGAGSPPSGCLAPGRCLWPCWCCPAQSETSSPAKRGSPSPSRWICSCCCSSSRASGSSGRQSRRRRTTAILAHHHFSGPRAPLPGRLLLSGLVDVAVEGVLGDAEVLAHPVAALGDEEGPGLVEELDGPHLVLLVHQGHRLAHQGH